MKKILFTVSLLLGSLVIGNIPALAANDIPMTIIVEGEISDQSTKGPNGPIIISQDENVLTLPALMDNFMLELRDEFGLLVYSTYVPSGTTLIVLPATLTGDYELRLVANTYYYMGYIVL